MKRFYFFISFMFIIFISLFFIILNKNKKQIYISYGNSDSKAKVVKSNLSEKQIIEKYKDYEFVKIDEIISTIPITYEKYIKNNIYSQYGMQLDNNIILLSEEIRTNNIYDNQNRMINFDNLNNYLLKKGINKKFDSISNFSIVKTKSKYLYNGQFIDLENNYGFNRRSIKLLKEEISEIINDAATVLENMNIDGEYIYGYRTNTAEKIDGYNILRHAGSTWSLILYYKNNPSEKLKEVIEDSIDYLISNYTIKYNNMLFVVEDRYSEITLGGNGLALLMLSEYTEVMNDHKYDNISKELADAIIYMQNKDGSFNHTFNLDFSLKDKFIISYYDGEAAFSLLKYYKICNDNYYLNTAKKAIDYFIDNNYEQYHDQWISYAINEFVKNNLDEKYIDFAFLNYIYNKDNFDSNNSFGPTILELLMTTFDTYNYVYQNKQDSESLKNFNIDDLNKTIEINLNVLLNYYINEEVAMYMNNPDLVLHGFHNINSNFQMRIDDIQHSITGLIKYNELILKKEIN